MAEPDRESTNPSQAGPARRVFHTLVAVAGWVLFVYWWWLVFRRADGDEIRSTLIFIALTLAAIVLLTMIWAIHNARIFQARGPRRQVRPVTPDFSHDSVGRPVELPAVPEECLSAGIVEIRIRGDAKVYAPGAWDDGKKEPAEGPRS
jgi:hypothetical protein